MVDIIKVIVTDSGGNEHIFNAEDDSELYLDMHPSRADSEPVTNCIRIVHRIFEGKATYSCEVESWFMAPRRIDLIYGEK